MLRLLVGLQGVWANAARLEAYREDLRQALEAWIVLGLRMGHHLPEIDGNSLDIPKQSSGSEQAEWTSLAMQALENASGANEPEYSLQYSGQFLSDRGSPMRPRTGEMWCSKFTATLTG